MVSDLEQDLVGEADWIQNQTACGVDEVGRGPLAGPVIAAAVVLDGSRPTDGIRDSKQLTAQQRMTLAESIRTNALAWSIGRCEPDEIDQLNILRASLRAMERAVDQIEIAIDIALVDGNIAPSLSCPVVTIVKGDAKVDSIGAASIIAKVVRDDEMIRAAELYPEYGFDLNKGYPTNQHLEALERHGPCPIHRRSFRPVTESLMNRPEARELF